MRARLNTAFNKHPRLRRLVRRLVDDKRFRFTALSLLSAAIGYALVYMLTLKGVGKWRANESVSKGMAPVGLALNTLALTGRWRPTRGQLAKWTAWWAPSALAGAVCTSLVVANFELGSLECRLVAGALMFPVDYTVKRFIVYSKARVIEELLARQRLDEVKAAATTRLWPFR